MTLKHDGIEKIIGSYGKYQTWLLILISIGRMPTEVQLLNVVFIIPNVNYVCLDEGALNGTNYCPCENPEYDRSTIISSVTSTWNLICNREQLASLAQSMLQAGVLVGSLFYGYISDRYGRKIAVILSLLSEVVFVALSAAVPELWMFMVLRFLTGTGVGGAMICCYVMNIEISGKSFRPYLAALIEVQYVASYLALTLLAYLTREWRHIQLISSLPWLLLVISFYWLIPESPRWLITTGKRQEAIDLLTYIAKKNKRSLQNIESTIIKIEEQLLKESSQSYGTYLDLFKTSKIRVYTIVVALVWMFCAHTFFGVNQYIGRLQGDLYLNVFLSATSFIPGLILVFFAAVYLRRKLSIFITFSIAALSLLCFIVVPNSMVSATLVFAIIGQVGIYTSFVLVYLYSSEIFPTMIRNSAMGFASVFARFGGFVAPFVVNIGVEWISISIFSTLPLIAACLCLLLPETKDTALLDTVIQAEKSNEVVITE